MENLYNALIKLYGKKKGEKIFWEWFFNTLDYGLDPSNASYFPSFAILGSFKWLDTIEGTKYWAKIEERVSTSV